MIPVFPYHRNGLLCVDFTDNHFTVNLYLYISSRSYGFFAYEPTNHTERVLGAKKPNKQKYGFTFVAKRALVMP